MSDTVKRGVALLIMAVGALLLGAIANANNAPTATTQALGLAVLIFGIAGLVFVILGLARRNR